MGKTNGTRLPAPGGVHGSGSRYSGVTGASRSCGSCPDAAGRTCPPGPKGGEWSLISAVFLRFRGFGVGFYPLLFQQRQGKAAQPRSAALLPAGERRVRGSAPGGGGGWGFFFGGRGQEKKNTHKKGAQNSPGLGFFLPLHDHKTEAGARNRSPAMGEGW